MREAALWAGAGALYAALAVVMTWPLAAEIGAELPAGGDNLYVAWLLAWVAHASVQAPSRLFDANIFFPAEGALAFSDPNVSSGLLLSPLYYATGSPAIVVNVLFLASFVLCGVTTVALVRDWGGAPRVAVACGLFFAFSPLRFSHVDHVQLHAFWWMPLSLLTLDRYLREGRRTPLGLAVAAVVLESYASIYLAVFQVAALALLALVSIGTGRARVDWRRTPRELLVAAAVGLVLCAPLGNAYFEASRRWAVARSLEENAYYSASPGSWLAAAPTNVAWGGLLEGFVDPTAPWEKLLFPGLVTPLLAAWALVRERGSFLVRYGALLFVIAAVLSLGPFVTIAGTRWRLPYAWAFDWLPPLRALRTPARWALAASFGLSLTAAAGASRLSPGIFWPIVLLSVAEACVKPLPTTPVPNGGRAPAVYQFLADSGRGPLIELPLGSSSADRFRLEPPRLYWSTLHWRPLANGYSGYTPAPYRELARLLPGGPRMESLRLLAAWDVTTLVVHLDQLDGTSRALWEASAATPGLAEVFRDAETRVFRIDASPVPFVAPRATVQEPLMLAPSSRQSVSIVFGAGPDPMAVPPAEIGWHSGRARWTAGKGEPLSGWARYFCPPAIPSSLPPQPLFLEPPDGAGEYRLELDARCFELAAAVTVSVPIPAR